MIVFQKKTIKILPFGISDRKFFVPFHMISLLALMKQQPVTSRCPDEIVRRIQVTASYEDPSWSGRLLETYDTQTDQFRIASCCWSFCQQYISWTLKSLSNFEILLRCSTSPSAEAPDFVYNLRRYSLIKINLGFTVFIFIGDEPFRETSHESSRALGWKKLFIKVSRDSYRP
ncbi:hypothetical protein CMV_023622 [Castanea mollissima]|uniref:Uncharacterized protein n=1 Tax=Castanea mollissima TaxID=60419 RepID=A0A8J4VDB0_9ROSI|nr:hypothetical protein CMV_023622 [Castanea mollissima]